MHSQHTPLLCHSRLRRCRCSSAGRRSSSCGRPLPPVVVLLHSSVLIGDSSLFLCHSSFRSPLLLRHTSFRSPVLLRRWRLFFRRESLRVRDCSVGSVFSAFLNASLRSGVCPSALVCCSSAIFFFCVRLVC